MTYLAFYSPKNCLEIYYLGDDAIDGSVDRVFMDTTHEDGEEGLINPAAAD